MPLRGESVGTAYVRILADGGGLPQSIRDEFDKNTGAFDDAGSVSAKHYKKSFEDEMQRTTGGRSLDKAFAEAVAHDDFSKAIFDTPEWKRFEHNVSARFGEQGTIAANQIRDEFIRSGGTRDLLREVEGVAARINRNVDEAIRAEERAARSGKKAATETKNAFEETGQEVEKFRARWKRFESEFHQSVSTNGFFSDLVLKMAAFGKALITTRRHINETGTSVDKNRHFFTRAGIAIDDVGNGVSKAFGRGSRNNLLNFFGVFTKGIFSIVSAFPKLLGGLAEFPQAFSEAQQAGAGFFKSVIAGFSNIGAEASGAESAIGELLATGPAGLAALAAAAIIAAAALGPIAALISGITAGIIALASSISFALVGALAALAPLLPVVAVGLGTIIAGVITLNKQQKKNFIHTLLEDFKDLGKIARNNFLANFNNSIGETNKLMASLHPLVAKTAGAFGDVAAQMVKGFGSPVFKTFLRNFEAFIPDAIRSLGRILQHTFGILGTIFTDSIPFARQFLHWLSRITGEADKWLRMHPGKVFAFLSDSVDSAKTFLHFLSEVGAVLVDLLFSKSGKATGDSLIGQLSDQLHNFDKFLDTHPRALQDFFKNGEDTFKNLGRITGDILKLFDALDSPEARVSLQFILDATHFFTQFAPVLAGISTPLTTAAGAINLFTRAAHAIGNIKWGSIFNPLKNINLSNFGGGGRTLLLNFTGWIPGAIGAISRFAGRIGPIIGRGVSAAGRAINGLLAPVGHFVSSAIGAFGRAASGMESAIARGAANVARFINGIPGRIGNIAGQFGNMAATWAARILSEISHVPQDIVDMFSGLAQRILNAIGSINIIPHINWPSPPGWLSKVTASGGVFAGAQARIIGEAGPEAVVPLNRPLSQVDPSVRWLSALAQGLTTPGQQSVVSPGKSVTATINVTTPTRDPVAVARETVNQLVATAY